MNDKSFGKTRSDFNKTKIFLSAAEAMKKEMEKMLINESDQDFWDVECDIAMDYVYYFSESNPKNLLGSQMRKSKANRVLNKHAAFAQMFG